MTSDLGRSLKSMAVAWPRAYPGMFIIVLILVVALIFTQGGNHQ